MKNSRKYLIASVINGEKELILSKGVSELNRGQTRMSVPKSINSMENDAIFITNSDFGKVVTKAKAKIDKIKKIGDNWIIYSILTGLLCSGLVVAVFMIFVPFSDVLLLPAFGFFVGWLVNINKQKPKRKMAERNCQKIIDWSL